MSRRGHVFRRAVPALGILVGLIGFRSASAVAQTPRGADTLSANSITDSLTVLNDLKRRVEDGASKDPAAWHHLGMVAWTLAVRAKAPEAPRGINAAKLSHMADTCLRIAADLAPMNTEYQVSLGRFLLGSGVAIVRSTAKGHFEKALRRARDSKNPAVHAEAALLYGRTFWWRYDLFANRRLPGIEGFAPNSVTDAMQPLARTAQVAEELANLQAAGELLGMQRCPPCTPLTVDAVLRMMSAGGGVGQEANDALLATSPESHARYDALPQTSMKDARQLIETETSALPPDVTGAADFERAFTFFHEAYDADPSFPGAFRAVAMIYADRSLWHELETLARNHLAKLPNDSLAWMALGLATHRQEKEVAAHNAFDSAFAHMSPRERDRLDTWQRVMPMRRAILKTEGTAEERSSLEQFYWMMASPFWADVGNETRIEFLSRVTFAELRWTVEEFRLSGADSDRGDIHVRYGPPEKIALIGPRGSDNSADVVMFWMYSNGLMFAFRGMPTFGTAHTAYGDGALVDALRQVQPVRWDNVSAPIPDSLPVQLARFRAGRDSVDIVFAAHLNSPDTIRKTMSIAADVRRYFWLVVPGSKARYSSSGVVDTAGVYSMSERIEPATLVYRVEEFGETGKRAGRATGALEANTTAFPLNGFGISDVLLGVNASPLNRTQPRWNGVRMAPIAGTVARGAELSLLWENYDFGQQEGEARYEVAVTLKRIRSAGGRIVAKINGAVTQTEDDRVVFRFDRAAPHASAFADQVSLTLGETPTGTYSLTLDITDRTTGKTASRTTIVRVID